MKTFCVGQSLGCNSLDLYLSVSSDLSLLGSIRSRWGCLLSRSDNGLRLGTPSHLITLPFPSLSASFVFSLGLQPHSVACGEILSTHLSTGDCTLIFIAVL